MKKKMKYRLSWLYKILVPALQFARVFALRALGGWIVSCNHQGDINYAYIHTREHWRTMSPNVQREF